MKDLVQTGSISSSFTHGLSIIPIIIKKHVITLNEGGGLFLTYGTLYSEKLYQCFYVDGYLRGCCVWSDL